MENRGGAGGNIGLDVVAKSAPDGYTIGLVAAGNLVINPFMYKSMPFNAFEDLTPVAPVAEAPQIVVIEAGLPAHTLREFIELVGSKPGAFHCGSGGTGTTNHLAGYLFSKIAGIEMVHVPYRGIAPVTALFRCSHGVSSWDQMDLPARPLSGRYQGTSRCTADIAESRK